LLYIKTDRKLYYKDNLGVEVCLSDVWPAILANGGSGSGLDADLLDGLNAVAFALVDHDHDYALASHNHSKLVAPGGDPDPALLVSDSGHTSISNGLFVNDGASVGLGLSSAARIQFNEGSPGPDAVCFLDTDVGVGTPAPHITSAANARVVTIEAVSDRAMLELSRRSDAVGDGSVIGQVGFFEGDTEPLQVAAMLAEAEGTNEDGADLTLWTKAPGGSLTRRVYILSSGRVGVNRANPTGQLQGFGTLGGFGYWEFDGVDATTQVIILGGGGGVTNCLTVMFSGVDSAGTLIGTIVPIANGSNVNITTLSTWQMRVNASGSFDIRRTAGTATLKINMWMVWQ
jgi:hypothetical protein